MLSFLRTPYLCTSKSIRAVLFYVLRFVPISDLPKISLLPLLDDISIPFLFLSALTFFSSAPIISLPVSHPTVFSSFPINLLPSFHSEHTSYYTRSPRSNCMLQPPGCRSSYFHPLYISFYPASKLFVEIIQIQDLLIWIQN